VSGTLPGPDAGDPTRRPLLLLEGITSTLLLAVVLALGWITLVANYHESLRLPSVRLEVVIVVVLLVLAVALVSLLALLHTRR
jgi:hypothetical protein